MQVLLFLGLLCIGAAILYVLLIPNKVKVGELVDGPTVLNLYKVGSVYKACTGSQYVQIQKEFSICNERLCPLQQGEQVMLNGKKYTVQLTCV
jgi:hypothetical protein